MKQFTATFLALAVLFCLAGCAGNSTNENPFQFYYCKSEITFEDTNSVIMPEERKTSEQDILSILNLYLKGPESDLFYNPFPEGSTIISQYSDSSTLYLTISEPFATLTGVELTLACACLSATTLALTDLQSVQIRCSGQMLDGNPTITFDADSLIWIDAAQTTPTTEP